MNPSRWIKTALTVLAGRQVYVVNADGTGTRAVTANTTWQASSPAWSPDGSRLAYSGTWVEAPNAMAAQRGAERLLLADLPYAVRDVDAKGA